MKDYGFITRESVSYWKLLSKSKRLKPYMDKRNVIFILNHDDEQFFVLVDGKKIKLRDSQWPNGYTPLGEEREAIKEIFSRTW